MPAPRRHPRTPAASGQRAVDRADARGSAGSPRRALRYALGGFALAAVLVAAAVAVLLMGGPRAEHGAPPAAEPEAAGEPLAAADPADAPAADPEWLARVAADTGIPKRALSAYASAALTLASEQPGCRLGWNMLAGIGSVESDHGRINGSRLLPSGQTTPRIIGVPLDGTRFIETPDTDGGAIDGDPEWDRAVGPMQFIPQTWEMFGRDGNGDGRVEIDQIDDAALSAAALLCDPGLDLTIGEHWIAALDGYNPSAAYNNDVADAAERYAQYG
ncbi:lytic murein transglycosylase [Leucobacter chromiiresistens]|nr:lytic murein transglycosylase [Leucobacter chromiiresistens]